ncbi:uncharacterized protein METZ01_LOCUS232524, partial [marine metagenome]
MGVFYIEDRTNTKRRWDDAPGGSRTTAR